MKRRGGWGIASASASAAPSSFPPGNGGSGDCSSRPSRKGSPHTPRSLRTKGIATATAEERKETQGGGEAGGVGPHHPRAAPPPATGPIRDRGRPRPHQPPIRPERTSAEGDQPAPAEFGHREGPSEEPLQRVEVFVRFRPTSPQSSPTPTPFGPSDLSALTPKCGSRGGGEETDHVRPRTTTMQRQRRGRALTQTETQALTQTTTRTRSRRSMVRRPLRPPASFLPPPLPPYRHRALFDGMPSEQPFRPSTPTAALMQIASSALILSRRGPHPAGEDAVFGGGGDRRWRRRKRRWGISDGPTFLRPEETDALGSGQRPPERRG